MLSELIQKLPYELQNKIYNMSFEGSANKVFKEFLFENDLFKYNFNLHDNYTLYQFIKDCNMLKKCNRYYEGFVYDVEEVLELVLFLHANQVADSSSDESYDSDESLDEHSL